MKLTLNHFKVFAVSLTVCLLIGYLVDVFFDLQLYQFLVIGAIVTLTTNYNRKSVTPKKQ